MVGFLAGLIGLAGGITTAIGIGAISYFLMRNKSIVWANYFVGFSALGAVAGAFIIVLSLFVKLPFKVGVFMLFLFIVWSVLFFVSLRARDAAKYLER